MSGENIEPKSVGAGWDDGMNTGRLVISRGSSDSTVAAIPLMSLIPLPKDPPSRDTPISEASAEVPSITFPRDSVNVVWFKTPSKVPPRLVGEGLERRAEEEAEEFDCGCG